MTATMPRLRGLSNDAEGVMAVDAREEYPTGVPCYIDSGRRDARAAMDFYGGLFGWEFENTSPGGWPPYYLASLQGHVVAGVGVQPDQTWDPVWNTYVCVEDVDAATMAVVAAGGTTRVPTVAVGDAGRFACFEDAQGAGFCVWEPGSMSGSALVNDPGAWVANDVVTADPDGAAAFYRSVFGWETRPLGDAQMFVRPGYGEFLARQQGNPNLAEEYDQMGAPEGFADMVAYLVPGDAASAGWGITFSVADADAAAARTSELGGTVLSGPTDLPWVREVRIRDSDGTQLTLSQFVPPDMG